MSVEAVSSNRWRAFEMRLTTLVRALPPSLDPTMRFADLAGFGEFDRVALKRAKETMLPGAPPDLISSIETVGELFEWVESRAAGTVERASSREGLYTDRVALRAVAAADMELLYRAAIEPRSGYRWRFRGATPSPQS